MAVTTRLPEVGRLCPWVKAGVGAVATQSYVKVEYGPRGLELLEQGKTPQEAIDEMLKDDPRRETRQLGIIDAKGNTANFTGNKCVEHASSRVGTNYTVQGNMLVGRETIDAVADSFEASEGSGLALADRLIAALQAGQAAGGDMRKGNRQSAAVLVAHPEDVHWDGTHVIVNLQVAEHAEPVSELPGSTTRFGRIWDIGRSVWWKAATFDSSSNGCMTWVCCKKRPMPRASAPI